MLEELKQKMMKQLDETEVVQEIPDKKIFKKADLELN